MNSNKIVDEINEVLGEMIKDRVSALKNDEAWAVDTVNWGDLSCVALEQRTNLLDPDDHPRIFATIEEAAPLLCYHFSNELCQRWSEKHPELPVHFETRW